MEKKKVKDLYKEEIIAPGDRASKLAHEVCIKSYKNCKAVEIIPRQRKNFRGAVDFLWRRPVLESMLGRKTKETVQNDGAGGKPQFATLVSDEQSFKNLGWEIIVMCADDNARSGGMSAIMLNQVDTKKITEDNFHLFRAMMEGYEKALSAANLVNITGELAIMKHSITAFCDSGNDKQLIITWSGGCIGLKHDGYVIDGRGIKPKMPIVGLHERGYRCNGGTFFTNLLIKKYKNIWDPEAIAFARDLTTPSVCYSRLIECVNGWLPNGTSCRHKPVNIKGISHITGGGIWGKFGELLPKGVGAYLDMMPDPPKMLHWAQRMSQEFSEIALSDWQAYSTFHGGCGMLVVCESDEDAMRLIREARRMNIHASVVGATTKSADSIIEIESRFLNKSKTLYSNKPF